MSQAAPLTASTAASGTGLFGGMFGPAPSGPSGLFSMLLSLFGQNAGGEQSAPDLSALTGLLPSANGTQLPLQLFQQVGATDQTGEIIAPTTDPSLPSEVDLLALFQNLANTPSASAELKALLGDTQALDLEAIKSRFAALEKERQQSLLGEIAALLMPPSALPPQPEVLLQTTEASGATPEVLMADPAAPAPQAAPPATHNKPQQLDTTQEKSRQDALAAVNQALKASSNREDIAIAQENSRQQVNQTRQNVEASQTADAARIAASEMTALTTPQAPRKAASSSQSGDESSASASATTAPVVSPANPGPVVQDSSQTQKTVRDIAAVQSRTHGEPGNDGPSQSQLRTAATDPLPETTTTNGTEGQRDAKAASFSEHLNKANLASHSSAHVPVSEQVAVQMSHALKSGQNQMTIKLKPAELGRIEVKINVER
jgi:flagellar hook-length control protein FliK